MYEKIGISNKIVELAKKTESEIQNEFKQVEEICEYNSLKVLKAFQKYNISDCLLYTSPSPRDCS